MPDRRRHRGPHPEDPKLFGAETVHTLREATRDCSWLLGRGYSARASIELVGDRYQLRERQRTAVLRSSCGDEEALDRRRRCIDPGSLRSRRLEIDGYNLLITVESGLSGGVVLEGCDGAYRDLASLHGSYRKVEETLPALEAIGQVLELAGPAEVAWFFDAPVSNSGRLSALIRSLAADRGWPWTVDAVADPDPVLKDSSCVVASSDSQVIDGCGEWIALSREVVEARCTGAWVVSLAAAS